MAQDESFLSALQMYGFDITIVVLNHLSKYVTPLITDSGRVNNGGRQAK